MKVVQVDTGLTKEIMIDGKTHGILVSKAIEELIKRGYKEIIPDYYVTIDGKRMRIDVVAMKDGNKIAVECYSQVQYKNIIKRVEKLKKEFDNVIIVLPKKYERKLLIKDVEIIWVDTESLDKSDTIDKWVNDEIREYSEKIRKLTEEKRKLEERIKELEQEISLLKNQEIVVVTLAKASQTNGVLVRAYPYIQELGDNCQIILAVDKKDNKLYFKAHVKDKWEKIARVVAVYVDDKFSEYDVRDVKYESIRRLLKMILNDDIVSKKIDVIRDSIALDIEVLKTEFKKANELLIEND